MTEPTATAKPSSLISRIIGVITSPKATFENVVAAPRPVGVMFVVALVIAIVSVAPQFTESGRVKMVDMQMKVAERVSQALGRPLPPDTYADLEAKSHSVPRRLAGMLSPFFGLPIWALFLTALYWVAFNTVLGGTAAFKQVLAVVTHSQVISGLGALLGVPIMMMTNSFSLSGPFNLGALMPGLDPDSQMAAFLGSISVFSLWGSIVTGIGLGVLYKRSGRNIAIALVILNILFMFALTAIFRAFLPR